MEKLNVTNNHDAPLSVAGVTIAAGATVGIPEQAIRVALNSNAVKTWLDLELIEIDGEITEAVVSGAALPPGMGGSEPPLTREQLEERATELGISFQGNTKDETLVKKITEAEEAAE